MKRSKTQRSFRNLLIDRRFQLRNTVAFAMVCLVLTSLFAGLFYHQVRVSSRVESTGIAEFDAALQEHMEEEDRVILWQMIGGILLLTILISLASILKTHRIVGPLYVLGRAIRELARGRWPRLRALRQRDEFQGLMDEFCEMVQTLRCRQDELAGRLDALAAEAGQGELQEALRELAAELRWPEEGDRCTSGLDQA